MAGQTARNRVDREAHGFALGAQAAGEFGHVLLGLRHRHAVTRDDDDAVSLVERLCDTVGVDGHLFALDRLLLACRAAKATQDHTDERPVHRLAHDVGQDRTRRADKRADDDQEIIAEAEADGRRRPAGITVEHGDHDRHVRPADAHDQVIADEERQQGQQDQRPASGVAHVHDGKQQRETGSSRVQQVPAGQFLGRGVDLARQFAIGDHRAGKGHGADPDTQHQFDAQDADLDARFLGNQLSEGGQSVVDVLGQADGGIPVFADRAENQPVGFVDIRHVVDHDVGIEADKNRREANQAVHDRHKFGHLGHLHTCGELISDARAQRDKHERDDEQPLPRSDERRDNRDGHPGDAVPHGALGAFLSAQPAERQDEENRCDRIGRDGESEFHDACPLRISGTWRACAVSRGSRRRC